MKLTIFNGSPRTGANNTAILLEKFIEGFKSTAGNECEVYKLNKLSSIDEAVKLFKGAECVLLAFPLYIFSTPAGVTEFIEHLEPFCGKVSDKKIGYFVQYGFPEAAHARPLEEYLESLTTMLGCKHLGTIIKGGCDGVYRAPQSKRYKPVLDGIYEIGKKFGEVGVFDKSLLSEYSKPETMPIMNNKLARFIITTLINKTHWDAQLKENKAYKNSFAKPYTK